MLKLFKVKLQKKAISNILIVQVDTEEITVENAIGRSFDQIIRHQLDPIWHQLGPKTRQLVTDLKTLRLILK